MNNWREFCRPTADRRHGGLTSSNFLFFYFKDDPPPYIPTSPSIYMQMVAAHSAAVVARLLFFLFLSSLDPFWIFPRDPGGAKKEKKKMVRESKEYVMNRKC